MQNIQNKIGPFEVIRVDDLKIKSSWNDNLLEKGIFLY